MTDLQKLLVLYRRDAYYRFIRRETEKVFEKPLLDVKA